MPALILPRRFSGQPQTGRVALAPEWNRDIRSRVWVPSAFYDPTSANYSDNGWIGTVAGFGLGLDGEVASFTGSQRLRSQQVEGGSNQFDPPLMLVVRCMTTTVAAGERHAVSVGRFVRSADLCRVGQNGGNLFAQYRTQSGSTISSITGTGLAVAGQESTLVFRMGRSSQSNAFYFNGRLVGTSTMPATSTLGAELFCVGAGHPSDGVNPWTGDVSIAGFLIGDYTDDEAQSLSYDPEQMIRIEPRRIYFDLGAGGGAAALEGASAAAASAAADLSTAIPLAGSSDATATATGDLALDVSLEGAASSAATATADLSTAIPLAGVSVSIASATGAVTTAIQLDGSAAAVSVSSGDLVTSISLSGAALAQAAAAAALSTGIPLAGTAFGAAAASGSLTAGSGMEGNAASLATAIGALTAEIRLSGAALAQALASADLTAPGSGLVGDAGAQSSASGLLGTAIPLAGPATATAGAVGALGSAILLSGAAAAISSATGDLTLSISFEGYSLAQALASGTLSTSITLSGAALAQALAAGSLTGAVRATPAFRTRVVRMKSRLLRIAA